MARDIRNWWTITFLQQWTTEDYMEKTNTRGGSKDAGKVQTIVGDDLCSAMLGTPISVSAAFILLIVSAVMCLLFMSKFGGTSFRAFLFISSSKLLQSFILSSFDIKASIVLHFATDVSIPRTDIFEVPSEFTMGPLRL